MGYNLIKQDYKLSNQKVDHCFFGVGQTINIFNFACRAAVFCHNFSVLPYKTRTQPICNKYACALAKFNLGKQRSKLHLAQEPQLPNICTRLLEGSWGQNSICLISHGILRQMSSTEHRLDYSLNIDSTNSRWVVIFNVL